MAAIVSAAPVAERKGTARAHPIQGLVKYHGMRDTALRIPFHDSVSLCTGPISSTTTVEFSHLLERDSGILDNKPAAGRELERIVAVIDPLRRLAKVKDRFRLMSRNDFPSNIGLGASSSGFAAAAAAANEALGLALPLKDLSRYARLGAASAARAVTGAYSVLRAGTGDKDTFSEQLAGPDLRLAVFAVIVPAFKHTEDAHKEAVASPFFDARVRSVGARVKEMEDALAKRDLVRIMDIAERDTLALHAITMTGPSGMIHWRPDTLRVMHAVREWRRDGLPIYFSIDTGATPYVNTLPAQKDEVEKRLRGLGLPLLILEPGREAHVVSEPLF